MPRHQRTAKVILGLLLCTGAGRAVAEVSPAEVGRLVPALASATADRRERAAEALGRLGSADPELVDALVRALADPDPYVNGRAAEALGRIGTGAVPALARALEDRNENVRWCAAIALGRMGPNAVGAVPALAKALRDSNANLRWSAVMAIGATGDGGRSAVPALLLALHDGDDDVRWGAFQVLSRVAPEALSGRPDPTTVVVTIESMVPALMGELHVPGVSVAVVRDRALAWSRSFGVSDVRTKAPVSGKTLFEACSMSKPVFACTVMQLAEQNRLDLDRPLVDYLDPPSLVAQPLRRLITARMVLSHTSGLPNWRKGEEEREGPIPVLFAPGSRFSYSGEGYFYLQRVVESITGEPIEVTARRTLFSPLGLDHTSYVWSAELDPDIACGHAEDGSFLQKSRYTHANAAYSLYTSAEDFAKLLVEILRTERTPASPLSERSVDAMLTRSIGLDIREPIERPGRAMGQAVFWGLGWSINSTMIGDIIHHSGANRSGFRCFSQLNRAEGSGIVIMTNGLSGDELWRRLIREIGDL
jgi:CubicO group peptidase (beta-lactamase class C family)